MPTRKAKSTGNQRQNRHQGRATNGGCCAQPERKQRALCHRKFGSLRGKKNVRVQGYRVKGACREDCLAYLPGSHAIILHNDF